VFDLEDEDITILGDVRNCTHNTVSHIRRLKLYRSASQSAFCGGLGFRKTSLAIPPENVE
jgi:hypothetical protein